MVVNFLFTHQANDREYPQGDECERRRRCDNEKSSWSQNAIDVYQEHWDVFVGDVLDHREHRDDIRRCIREW